MKYVTLVAYTKVEAEKFFRSFIKLVCTKFKISQPTLKFSTWYNNDAGFSDLITALPITKKTYENHNESIKKLVSDRILLKDFRKESGGDFIGKSDSISIKSYIYKLKVKHEHIIYEVHFVQETNTTKTPSIRYYITVQQKYELTISTPKLNKKIKEEYTQKAQEFFDNVNNLLKRRKLNCPVKNLSDASSVHFTGTFEVRDNYASLDIRKALANMGKRRGYPFSSFNSDIILDGKKIGKIILDSRYDDGKYFITIKYLVKNPSTIV